MARKSILLAPVIAILVFAAPAGAATSYQLTMPFGITIPLFTKTLVASTNARVTTSIGTLACAKLESEGEVTENSGSSWTIAGTGAGTATTCTDEGTSISITDLTLSDLHSSEAEKGTANFSFKADLPVIGTCTYTGSKAPFTYASGSSVIKFTKATLTVSPTACGTASFDAEFTTETPGGGGVFEIDS